MRVRMFAALRELAGTSEVELTGCRTVGALVRELSVRLGPRFDAIMAAGSVVVNGETVPPDHPLGDDDQVALLPPVSGGSRGG
jgi:molybdopterin synthase sulfur carrier subunit